MHGQEREKAFFVVWSSLSLSLSGNLFQTHLGCYKHHSTTLFGIVSAPNRRWILQYSKLQRRACSVDILIKGFFLRSERIAQLNTLQLPSVLRVTLSERLRSIATSATHFAHRHELKPKHSSRS